MFNFSDKTQDVTFKETLFPGTYQDFTTEESITLSPTTQMTLAPWSYKVFVK
ncbi:hypothetical protein [Flavobacterium piscinae]|uniref:hypothetical protein n=1 Tax=Flavobacterium piscinae TaxID=2506424 RepID=UPI002AAC074E|nr:hypothetical protein [Flavobacterium piscinae]